MSIRRLVFLVGLAMTFLTFSPQFTAAQKLKPIPHSIGITNSAQAQRVAKSETPAAAEVHPEVKAAASTSSSPWTPLTNQPNFLLDGASVPILLTDGSVLIQDAGFPDWWKLTPDKFGSYVNGTWSQVASLPAT